MEKGRNGNAINNIFSICLNNLIKTYLGFRHHWDHGMIMHLVILGQILKHLSQIIKLYQLCHLIY
jgi:hypothetical protein